MLNPAEQNFTVILYNQFAVDAVEKNITLYEFSERWATPQCICLQASSLEAVQQMIKSRFPSEQGFVIQDVSGNS